MFSIKTPSKDENGNIYKYILSCLDVFSRCIFLRRLKSKDTIEGFNQLKEIFITFGSPRALHCGKGFGIPMYITPYLLLISTNWTTIMYLYCKVVLCLFHTKVKTKHFFKKFLSTHCVSISLSLFYYPLSSSVYSSFYNNDVRQLTKQFVVYFYF